MKQLNQAVGNYSVAKRTSQDWIHKCGDYQHTYSAKNTRVCHYGSEHRYKKEKVQ